MRQWINEHVGLAIAVAVLALVLAAALTYRNQLRPRSRGQPTEAYFFDLVSGTLFAASAQAVAPIDGANGPITDAGGRQRPAGIRAAVFRCGGCPSSLDGMTLDQVSQTGAVILYLDRYSDRHKRRMQEQDADNQEPAMPMLMIEDMNRMALRYAKVPQKPGTYPRFYLPSDPIAQELRQRVDQFDCPDQMPPVKCYP